jgi:AcrR family transcriptional regulator
LNNNHKDLNKEILQMTRISKSPEERKSEFLEAAEILFNTKGFEQTTVKDIVQKVGVAQGLFYYYFKTKEDVLKEIVNKYVTLLLDTIGAINNNAELTAKQKMERVISIFFNMAMNAENITDYIHNEGINLHTSFDSEINRNIIPIFAKIIEQGVEEGSFDTQYPFEVAGALLAWINSLHKSIHFNSHDFDMESTKKAIVGIIERVLGVKSGSFCLEF